MKLSISPARALAYRPLRSRASHTCTGVATWTSRKSPTSRTMRAARRAGPRRTARSARRWRCRRAWRSPWPRSRSGRCSGRGRRGRTSARPRAARRTRSPSSSDTVRSPRSLSASRSARAIVDLPEPDRPVKKMTRPRSLRGGRARRSSAATAGGVNQDGYLLAAVEQVVELADGQVGALGARLDQGQRAPHLGRPVVGPVARPTAPGWPALADPVGWPPRLGRSASRCVAP